MKTRLVTPASVERDRIERLNAAAPDLLHALQSLMSWIDNKPLPCTVAVLDAWSEELHHRENRARAAIAKAEG